MPAVGRRSSSRTGVSGSRSERCVGCIGSAHHAHAGSSKFCDQRTRSVVQHVAACLRRNCLVGAVLLIRFHPDRAAPRLLPRRQTRQRGSARSAAIQHDRCRQRRSAVRRTRRHCGPREITHADAGNWSSPARCAKPVVGIVIAALVLLPEGLAALRAARANQLQTSLNLALGSALASIGLTIPVVAGVSIVIRQPLELGLGTKDEVLLALTLLTGVITLGTGRTTVLQGIVHLVIFAVFLFFAVVP